MLDEVGGRVQPGGLLQLERILPAANEMTMTEPTREDLAAWSKELRQLALVDRIIGLEAQVANLQAMGSGLEARKQLKELRSSTSWKVGRLVLAPVLFLQKLARQDKRA